jgi:hypothetical protein
VYFFKKRAILARSGREKSFIPLSIEHQHGTTPGPTGD